MVTVIKTSTSIRRIFLYNEHKVEEGVATCLLAENYPMEAEDMTQQMRLNMLLKTVELNPNIQRNSVHISLNFAVGEKLSHDVLRDIAKEYMELIGFGDQPYLVYEHRDAGHPHLHIVAPKIRPDGTRIDMQNIGKNQSTQARLLLEKKYGLVAADDHKRDYFKLAPISVQKIQYGRTPTKRAIQNVLAHVIEQYKFASLAELNAVLNLYNVSAERGSEDSRIYKNNGLVYRMLDAHGKSIGIPIKASSFYNNPGLRFLEKQYLKNNTERAQHKNKVKNAIDLLLIRNPKITLEQLVIKLKAEGIDVAIRQNTEGLIYGLTYVDHRFKCVFNGSALGKAYSAKAMLERLSSSVANTNNVGQEPKISQLSDFKFNPVNTSTTQEKQLTNADQGQENTNEKGLIEGLMQHEYTAQGVPYQWKKRKRRRKRR